MFSHPNPFEIHPPQPRNIASVEGDASAGGGSTEKKIDWDKLTKKGFFETLETLPPELRQEYAIRMIDAGRGFEVAQNIYSLHNVNHSEIALKLLERKGEDGVDAFLENNIRFYALGPEVANKLFELGKGAMIARYIGHFCNLSHEIAFKLIDEEGEDGESAVFLLSSFCGFDRAFVIKLIEAGNGWHVVGKLLHSVRGIADKDIALRLIQARRGWMVLESAWNFQGLDRDIILKLLETIEMTDSRWILFRVENFQGLDREIAFKLIRHGCGIIVVQDRKHFQGLDIDVAVRIAKDSSRNVFLEGRDAWAENPNATTEVKEGFAFLFDETIPEKIRFSKETETGYGLVGREGLEARSRFGITPLEYATVKKSDPEALALDQKGHLQDPDRLMRSLFVHWEGEDEVIKKNLKKGVEVFGAKAMLEYMNRVELNRHDAVFFFRNLLILQRKSGIAPDVFVRNILLQVAKDGGSYAGGISAHHHLATIVNGISNASFDPKNPKSLPARLAKYRGKIKSVDQLIEQLSGENLFVSWRNLKKAYEAHQLLKKSELLDALVNEPNGKMRSYVESLAFHPGIAMESVMQFWREPARFLDIKDEHAPQGLGETKKPSHYLSEPYLGLSAENLRDAVVGRADEDRSALDRLQTILPAERRYEIADRPEDDPTDPDRLFRYFSEAMGKEGRKSGEKKVEGKAQSPRLLYGAIVKLLKDIGQDAPTFAELRDNAGAWTLLKEKHADVFQRVQDAIFHHHFGMEEPKIKRETYRVRIGSKSDPSIVVAGNDTASCMPFGSGKNNVYTFNPNCAQLVLERLGEDGEWRTAAQSVLTINQETSVTFPELRQAFFEQGKSLEDLIHPEDFAKPRMLACDNIEIAKNEEGRRSPFIRQAYERFFREYLAEHADALRVDPSRVVIGKGYTPVDLGWREVPNKTVPLVPVSYSDNVHENSFLLETGLVREQALPQMPMVRPIQVTDVYAVADLESKAFEGTTLGYGIHKVQNNLIGIQIANEMFQRPNLSFISQADGKPASAYVVAYEGIIEKTPAVYVDDMAAESKGHPSGGRILLAFVDAYVRAYATRPELMPPIVANMRDTTSFQLVKNSLARISKGNKLLTEMVELGESRAGADTLHHAAIIVGRTPEELESARERVKHFSFEEQRASQDEQEEQSFDDEDDENDVEP